MDNAGSHASGFQSQSKATDPRDEIRSEDDAIFRLHIGGKEAKAGWKIFDIQPGDSVDFVGDCRDLSRFDDTSSLKLFDNLISLNVETAKRRRADTD